MISFKTTYKIRYIFILLAIPLHAIWGQTLDSTSAKSKYENFWADDGRHLVTAAVRMGEAPFSWDKNDLRKIGFYLGATGITMFADPTVKKYSQDNQSEQLDQFFQIDKYYGTGYMLIMSGGIYLGGILGNDRGIRILGLKTFEAFIYSGLIANLIKPVIGRRRPYGGDNHLVFNPFTLDNKYHALPSGHATVSFAVSAVMAKEVDNFFWDAFWYSLAGWTAAARIYHNQHWFSDTIAGSLLGYSIGSFLAS